MNIISEQIQIPGVVLDFSLEPEEFYDTYLEYVGMTLVSNEYNQGQVFTLKKDYPHSLRLSADRNAENHVNAIYSAAATKLNGGSLTTVIIPEACFKFKDLEDIPIGSDIVYVRNVEIGEHGSTFKKFKTRAIIDFAKVISYEIKNNTPSIPVEKQPSTELDKFIRVELKAIPGQIEQLRDPMLIGLNIDVIPFMT